MYDGFTAIVGGRVGLAAGLVEFRRSPPDAANAIAPGLRLSPAGDYLMWGVSAQHDRLPAPDAELAAADAAALHAVACAAIRSWHPDLRALLARAAVDETFYIRVRSSERVPAWAPSRVTLLGDAIHAMSPACGSGANTALLDAANLCAALTSGSDVVEAIGGYEEGCASTASPRLRPGSRLQLWIFNHLPKLRGHGDSTH
jgi:2-polyprenyl-6-methoxyphenol hydroxylase-like FAD-dependent oxidoreductase